MPRGPAGWFASNAVSGRVWSNLGVPLDDAAIDAAVERYRREMDRYAKLVELVESACRDLVSDNAIPATVQSRAKDPD